MVNQKHIFLTLKTWLKEHWRLQLTALVVVGAVAWLGVWFPYLQLKSNIRQGLTQSSLAHRQTQNLIDAFTTLPKPTAIQPGVFGSTTRHAQTIQAQSDANKPQAMRTTPRIHALSPYPSASVHRTIEQVNDISDGDRPLIKQLNTELPAARATIEFHASSTKILANILEYDPQTDFSKFDASSEDTKTRLRKAEAGLDKTWRELKDLSWEYRDPSLTEVLTTIENLEKARANLAKSGDTANWAAQVRGAQRLILQNRAAFWNKQSEKHLRNLAAAREHFGSSTQAWRRNGQDLGIGAQN